MVYPGFLSIFFFLEKGASKNNYAVTQTLILIRFYRKITVYHDTHIHVCPNQIWLGQIFTLINILFTPAVRHSTLIFFKPLEKQGSNE